jgi:hypothetical protein
MNGAGRPRLPRLWRRRSCLAPTASGCLVLLLGILLIGWLGLRGTYPFLAVNDPRPGGILVVEGWVPDFALESVAEEFKLHSYEKLYTTGVPLEQGTFLSEYKTYAELGAATLAKMSVDTNKLEAVPTPGVTRDRTYASALALRKRLAEGGPLPARINLVSVGPHARRSRLMFQKAFGPGVEVGVVALAPHDYDPRRWWRSSAGVRGVIGEALAYGYARVLFRTEKR